jgi:hypothetical protein
MQTLSARYTAAVDLLEARKALSATQAHQVGQKVLLQGKVDALRSIVSGKAAKAINLLAPKQTVAELRRLWDGLMKDAKPEDRQMAAKYMRMIVKYARQVNAQQGAGPLYEADALENYLVGPSVETVKPEFELAQAARWIDSKRAAQVNAVAEEMSGHADRVKEARAAYKTRIDALREIGSSINSTPSVKELADRYRHSTGTSEERYAAYQAYQAEFNRVRDEAKAKIDAGKAEADRELAAVLDSLGGTAAKLKTEFLAGSPISAEAGKAWADAQEIDSSAKTAMKKLGYPVEKVREDVAEFYRLTGGRLAKVRIKGGTGRASASGIHGHKNRTIKMGAGFDKRVLFHELGHHLEADPQVYAAANGFLLRRRESPTVYALSSLTGNRAYGRNEGAYKDKFFDPYVGKVYRDNATEVFSMGLESFASPGLLAERMAADPEHFKLIAGFLDTTPNGLLEAVKDVLGQAAESEEEAEEQAGSLRGDAMRRLAAGAALVRMDPVPEKPWSFQGPGYTYEGSINGGGIRVDLYAGKFRDYSGTKRLKKGWSVVRWKTDDGGRQFQTARSYFDHTEALAAARVVAQTGEYPSGALSELQKTAEALSA